MPSEPDVTAHPKNTSRESFPVLGTVLVVSLVVVGGIVSSIVAAIAWLAIVRLAAKWLAWPVPHLLWASAACLLVLGLLAAATIVVFALRALHDSIENESARSEALLDQLAMAEDADENLGPRRNRTKPRH